jgi:predicted ribosomally synthesized peptide with SipW-like signal peptide
MKNKINKFIHSKYLLISLIVLLVLLVIATGTYAWFTWRSTSNTSLTMNIGKLADVTFNSGNDISTSTLAPVYNYTDGEKTTFSINNKDTTGASLDYNIKLNITSIANELKSSDLKYVLLKDNTIVKEGNFSTMVVGANTIYSNSISSSGTTNFTFYLYIDGNSENNLNMMNKSLVGSIVVEAQENYFETFSTVIENLMADGEYETVTGNGTDYEYNTVNSLMDDNYGNIRYYGANPNNYVYFNCDDYSNQSSSTCEVWRIIGVFNNGNLTHQIKIIRNESIGTYQTNEVGNEECGAFTDSCLSYTLNNEAGSKEATYWSRTLGNCNLNINYKCDFSKTGLKNTTTRDSISNVSWFISNLTDGDSYPNDLYQGEIDGSTTAGEMISIMYKSDYGYATDIRKCNIQVNLYNSSECTENNWLFLGSREWIMGPTENNYYKAYIVADNGAVETYSLTSEANVRPTLYLKTEQTIKSGTGTLADPYQLVIR